MGRPKAFNREEAVHTAMNTIWKQGYKACSVKVISEKLGITRSSFYNAFGSREELYIEAVQTYFDQLTCKDLTVLATKDSILKELCIEIYELCSTRGNDPEARGCFVVNGVTELMGVDEKISSVLVDVLSAGSSRIEEILEIAIQRDELPKQDVYIKARALQSVLIGINVMSKVIHDQNELWAIAKHSLEALELYRD
jgi:TetR/AcrR family transcriptional repressor of nem operon